jgi:hypothetical protein
VHAIVRVLQCDARDAEGARRGRAGEGRERHPRDGPRLRRRHLRGSRRPAGLRGGAVRGDDPRDAPAHARLPHRGAHPGLQGRRGRAAHGARRPGSTARRGPAAGTIARSSCSIGRALARRGSRPSPA